MHRRLGEEFLAGVTFVEVRELRLVALKELRLFLVTKVQHQYLLTDLCHVFAVLGRGVAVVLRVAAR